MPNQLDAFFERCNAQTEPIIGDRFSWLGTDYIGVMSDLVRDEFFADDARGKPENAERTLECAVNVFAGALPQIRDTVVYLSDVYAIVEVESHSVTNIAWRIRKKMGAAV